MQAPVDNMLHCSKVAPEFPLELPSKMRSATRTKGSETTRPTFHHGKLRAELVGSALTTVETLGHESLSVRDAARLIGVTHTAAYRHFADRDALLAAVTSQGFRAMRGTILRGLKRGGEDAVERSIQGGVACVVYCVEHARLVRLMVAAGSRRPATRANLRQRDSSASTSSSP